MGELRAVALVRERERLIPWSIFVLALVLRLVNLDSIPNTVTADELDFARDQLATIHGQGPGFFGLDWTGEPAMSMYLRTWTWQALGPSLFTLRLVSAVLTSLAVFPFYWVLRRMTSISAAGAATVLLATAWWLLLFGRSAWNNGDIVTYTLWSSWALLVALEKQRSLYWALFGASLALLLYGYLAGRAVVLAFVVYFPILLVQSIRSGPTAWRNVLKGAILAGAVCLALFSPEIRTILANPGYYNLRMQSTLILAHMPAGESGFAVFRHQLSVTFNSFFLMDQSTNGRYKGVGMAWLDVVTMIFFYVGLGIGLVKFRTTSLWWILLLIPLAITQLLTIDIPNGARGIPALVPMCLFAGLGIDFLLNVSRRAQLVAQVVLLLLVGLAIQLNFHSYEQWIDSPVAVRERQPAVPSNQFDTWRRFQEARLRANLQMLNATDYVAMSPAAIAAQIAGKNTGK